ncbi:A-kinase anchor protein 17A isoform X2 [Harpegnathos saltator]|uniref:A-kinase anchor protein 17A isoform X2 n=1 Tax=Harpegnathos saltator TaxID=610380 RepID=UPI000DBEE3DC|nr:A-kinase anchor protein 17A isoform X2 [Harpegnathos saltator]
MQREEHKPITMDDDKQVGETSSSEVANRFRSCRDLSDIVSLYPPRALYLKPLAKVNVSVNLPQLKTPGKTISTWEVMEKIRALILPDEFVSLKVAKSTLEFIRLEGDLRDRCRLQRVLARLDLQRLNLAGFTSVLKVRAAETKDDFPTRHNWDSYFRDAKHMNELKAGERPDTIHISGLPVKWFTEDDSNTPSESLIVKIFKKWGALRRVDVPAADPYRSRMRLGNNIHKFSYEEGIYFDVYIQYVEYMAFVRAMDALRGMKLLKKDEQNSLTATMKVDFDKTKHMSDNSVSHRDFERKRLIAQDNLAAEKLRKKEEEEKKRREEQKKKEEADSAAKVSRQQKREEKRKRKALKMFRKQEEDKVSMKIAREEQKLIKAQRQLESMRLLDELFDRIKTKVEKNEIKLGQNMNVEARKDDKKNDQTGENANKLDSESEKKGKKEDVKKKKLKKEKKKKKKRKKKRRKDDDSGSDSSLETLDKETSNKKMKNVLTKNNCTPSSADATLPYADAYDPIQMLRISTMSRYPSMSPGMQMMRIPMSRYPGAQMLREPMARYHYPVSSMRRGRGYFPRCDLIKTRSGSHLSRATVESPRADQSRKRETRKLGRIVRQEPEAPLDLAAGDAAVRVSEAAVRDRSQRPDRAPDRDRAAPDPDENRVPGAALNHGAGENRPVDLLREKGQERGRDRGRVRNTGAPPGHVAKDAAARAANDAAADQYHGPEHVVRGPGGSRDPKVAPDPAAALGIVTGRDTVGDPPQLSGSHEQNRELHRPSGGRVAVRGLCRDLQIEEVFRGRKLFPKPTLAKT